MPNWRTIASAPKDGTKFLGYSPNPVDISYSPQEIEIWWWKVNSRTDKGYFTHTDEMDDYELENNPPSRWMPLPKKPEEEIFRLIGYCDICNTEINYDENKDEVIYFCECENIIRRLDAKYPGAHFENIPMNPNRETREMAEKYCKDCKHYENHGCHDRDDAVDLVSSEKIRLSAASERLGVHHSRALIIAYKPCGREAEHFESKAE